MKKAMTRAQFKKKWESNDSAGGISFSHIADCAKAWGLFSSPKTHSINRVTYEVLKAAGTKDAEDYNPFPPRFIICCNDSVEYLLAEGTTEKEVIEATNKMNATKKDERFIWRHTTVKEVEIDEIPELK